MAAFRLIAWIILALAMGLLGADAITSMEQNTMFYRTTADIMGLFGVDGAALAANAPSGASKAIGTLLGLPLWAFLGVIGVVLTLIFRPLD